MDLALERRHARDPSRFLALVVLSFVLACGRAVEPTGGGAPPHIVVVLIDTLRADHTTVYGGDRDTTPCLARVASEGTVMGRHFSNAPWTKPSVASILTGLHPSAHGSRRGQFMPIKEGTAPIVEALSESHVTFIEVLRELGYRTLAHVSNYNMLVKWGYGQGYDRYEHVRRDRGARSTIEGDRESIQFAIDALDAAENPTFVWSHLMSVHQYHFPSEHDVFDPDGATPVDRTARNAARVKNFPTIEAAEAAYDNAIHYCDALVGKLADAIRERHPNTILIVTSDHGEEFFEHGGFDHCSTLYDELLRVPLVIVGPGIPKNHRVEGITDSLDLYPTILALAGIPTSDIDRPGQVLVGDGRPTAGKAETFAEQHHRGPEVRFAVLRDERKLIRSHRKIRSEQGAARTGEVLRREYFANLVGIEGDPLDLELHRPAAEELERRIDATLAAAAATLAEVVGGVELSTLTSGDLNALREIGYAGDD